MKNILLIGFLVVLLSAASIPMHANAALTEAQIQAILGLLQSFGADQATVNNVDLSLRGLPTTATPNLGSSSAVCNFLRDLTVGSSGEDVKCLQNFLKVTPSSGYFGNLTKQALINWQSKNGVSPTSGYFGPLTRKRIAVILTESGTITTPPSSFSSTTTAPTLQTTPTPAPASTPEPSPVPTPTPSTQSSTSTQLQTNIVSITPTLYSAQFEWTTSLPVYSKIFVSGNGISKVIQSNSGLSTRHLANVTGLKNGKTYTYMIESVINNEGFTKDGTFSTQAQTFSATLTAPYSGIYSLPKLKFSSDAPYTIKKFVFLNDETYCYSMYEIVGFNANLITPISGIGGGTETKDANSKMTIVFAYVNNPVATPNATSYSSGNAMIDASGIHISSGDAEFNFGPSHSGPKPTCSIDGIRVTLLGSESEILNENGEKINLQDFVLQAVR